MINMDTAGLLVPFCHRSVDCFVCGSTPFLLFLIPKMTAQHGTNPDISHSLSFSVDLAKDFLISIKDTFTYFFLRDQSSIGKVCIILLSVILVILGVIYLLSPDNKQRNNTGEAVTLASFISFLLYFFAVKMNYYGMVFVGGTFGNHWGLAIGIMILFVGIFLMSESYASYPKITLICMAFILFLLVAGSEDTPSILLEALQSLGYEAEEIPTEIMTDSNLADMPMKSYLYQFRLHEL